MNNYRDRLIVLVFEFLKECIKINGISRISIIGSLATTKEHPKDADILLNIADDLELKYLAKISRRLQGKTGELNSGADIFVADLNNKYLGRICHWKDCRFGVRQRCDALNCGKRQYLHDDLNTITLKKELIDYPPLEIYPNLIKRIEVPNDLEDGLISKLEIYKLS